MNLALDKDMGIDPFSFQKAKIANERKKAEEEKRLAELKAQQDAEKPKKSKKSVSNTTRTRISSLTTRTLKASTSPLTRWKKTA